MREADPLNIETFIYHHAGMSRDPMLVPDCMGDYERDELRRWAAEVTARGKSHRVFTVYGPTATHNGVKIESKSRRGTDIHQVITEFDYILNHTDMDLYLLQIVGLLSLDAITFAPKKNLNVRYACV